MASRRKTSRRSPRRKTSRRSKRTKRRSATKRSCQTKLKNKIRINMGEYKKGKFSSRQQALAVSYAQVKKKSPGCKRFFSKRR